jgi:oligopeptide transport system substrate-binding protein
LDPGFISDDASSFIVRQLFEGLVTVDAENNVLPAAAARWEILEAGQRYRFYLRKGLRWSDGSVLTAEDFVRTWQRNLKLARRSSNAQLLFVIKNAREFADDTLEEEQSLGVIALDDHTLEITLEAPIAYLPHLLTLPIAYPLPPDLAASDETLNIAKSSQGCLTLHHNKHYRGFFPGNILQVEGCPVGDYAAAFDQFERGELDMLSMITSDPKTVRQARRRFGEMLKFIPHPSTFFVTFCCDRPPFDSAVVRKAFVHAVDRAALVAETSQGQYQPALGGFLPPGMPGHQPKIGLAYDPEKSRALLATAGFPGGEGFPSVDFLFTGPDPHDPLIDFLCQAWERELGVPVHAENKTWEAFIERRDQDPPHLSTMGYTADYPDPDAMLRVLFHKDGYLPLQLESEQFDRLVENAARTLDPVQREGMYWAADALMVAEWAAVMPLGYARSRILISNSVSISGSPAGRLQFKDSMKRKEER